MQKLIGRDVEKEDIYHCLRELDNGKGSLLLVSGEAGVGKTALVEDALHSTEATVYTARANEDVNSAYSLFSSVLRNCHRGHHDIDCGPLKKYLAVLMPEIGTPPDDTDAETLKEAVLSAVISMGKTYPVIIFFDDIHWADNATLDLLPFVADKITNYPILIICTYRTDEISKDQRIRKLRSDLKRSRKLKEINIEPLNFNLTRTLIKNILGKDVTDETAKNIYTHTAGFPLFTEEVLESLKENHLILELDNKYELDKNKIIPIPESIKDTVLQKFTLLSDQAKEALETAAVIGQEFYLSLLMNLTGKEEELHELFENTWLVEKNEGKAAFKHKLMREAVKSQITWIKRKRLHKEYAEYLVKNNASPEIIAENWLAAGENEKAVEALIQSIDQYSAVYDYKDAAGIAKRIIDMWQPEFDEDKKIAVLMKYSYCAQLSGAIDESISALKDIIDFAELKKDQKLLATSNRSLAEAYELKANWELSVKCRVVSAEYFLQLGLPQEASVEYLMAASKSTAMRHLEEAIDYANACIQIAESNNLISIKTRAMGLYGNVFAMLGKYDVGKKIVQDALTIALDNDESDAASEIYRRLASSMEYAADYFGARSVYNNAYDFCINHGKDINASICLSCMTYLFFQTGEWKKSLEMCREVLKSKYTPVTSLPVGYTMTGLIQAFRGETKPALKNLNTALHLATKYKTAIAQLYTLWGLAINYENNSDYAGAEEYYNSIISLWHDIQDMHDVIPLLMWGVVFFNKRNSKKELTQVIGILTKVAGATGNPRALGALAFAHAESAVLTNNLEEALEQYNQALAHIENRGVPLEQLMVEYRLSLAAIKYGDTQSAEKYLNRAFRTAKNLGTRPMAFEISETMVSIGLKTEESRNPESAERINKFGLTQRQYEILELVGEGLTNKEIAGKLFLSARTVDMHVSNILQRLNCRTRTEAISKAKEFSISE